MNLKIYCDKDKSYIYVIDYLEIKLFFLCGIGILSIDIYIYKV